MFQAEEPKPLERSVWRRDEENNGNSGDGADGVSDGSPGLGVNAPLEGNLAVAGVGPVEDDVVAQSFFFGGDFATAGPGALDVTVGD